MKNSNPWKVIGDIILGIIFIFIGLAIIEIIVSLIIK
jgi:Na+/phosphate symporter